VRGALKAIGRWLLRPTTVGAMYMLALVALVAGRFAHADEALAGQTRAISGVVYTHFHGEVRRIGIAIVAASVLVGALLGLASSWLVLLRDRMARRGLRTRASLAWSTLLVTAVLQALAEAWAMADSPQLYAATWYACGGALRTLQVLVTDVLGPRRIVTIGVVLLLLFLAGPRSQWRRWPRRLGRALLPREAWTRRQWEALGAASASFLLVVLGLEAASRVAHARGSASGPPNIVILAADSLRADRMDPRVAPHLAKLAERATRFDHAYVSLPRTFPSWVTLLTGRHPHHHGIRSMFPRWEERTRDFDALPSHLAQAGYLTSVVSDYAGDIFGRIDLGFARVDTPRFDFRQLIRQRALERQTPLLPFLHSRMGRSAFPVLREMNDAADPDMLADDAIRAIRASRGKPMFLTVFFSTAHFPYAAPAPYYARFTRAAYRGRFKYDRPVGLEGDAAPDAEDIAQIRGLYDGAVASVDAAMGRVLLALEREGVADRTIVVVTADHGETLYDGGHGAGHGDHLFGDEGTHVPLIVVDPRREQGQRLPQVVRDVDLAPTLYALAGIPAPGDLDGQSLAPALDGEDVPAKPAFAETGLWFTGRIEGLPESMRLPYPGVALMTEIDAAHDDDVVLKREVSGAFLVAKHRMVRGERYKLVYVPTREGVRYLLFDTVADPGETRDVAAQHPDELGRLKGELWSWMLADPRMVESRGFLVPRDVGAASTDPTAIRVDGANGAPGP
jgi:arylsulfatase A-like enzyme